MARKKAAAKMFKTDQRQHRAARAYAATNTHPDAAPYQPIGTNTRVTTAARRGTY